MKVLIVVCANALTSSLEYLTFLESLAGLPGKAYTKMLQEAPNNL